jgi:hypothetical protein
MADVDPDRALRMRTENPWYRGCRPEHYNLHKA